MADFLESLSIEAFIAILFGFIGVVSTKILSPFFSFIIYKKTREYPSGKLKKLLNTYDNIIFRILRRFWYKKNSVLEREYFKYDIRVSQNSSSGEPIILFSRNSITNLEINILNLVTATYTYQEPEAGIYSRKEIELIGYYKDIADVKVLFLEEKKTNAQTYRFEKSEFIIPRGSSERTIFGHSLKYDPAKEVIDSYQTFLYPEKRTDLYTFIKNYPENFNQVIKKICTKENIITINY